MSLQYKPFTLLRLPYLASCEIIRNMDLLELIPLAVQSKRAKRLVKMCSQIDTINVRLDGDFLRIYHDFQSVISCLTNMEQDVTELEAVVNVLMDLLKSPTFSIDLKVNGSTQGILNFLETVKELKIDRLSVAVKEVYIDDVYEKILYDFQNLELLEIKGEVSLDFVYPLPLERDFKLVQLGLVAPVEHIADVFQNCQTLELDGPYSDRDVNYLLNRWWAGSPWKYVTIKNNSDYLSTILMGMEHEPVAKANLDGSIQRFYVDTCAVIKQFNGIEALVFLDYKNCVLTLSTDFDLDVEPEDYLEEDEEDAQNEEVVVAINEEDLRNNFMMEPFMVDRQGFLALREQEQEIHEEEEEEELIDVVGLDVVGQGEMDQDRLVRNHENAQPNQEEEVHEEEEELEDVNAVDVVGQGEIDLEDVNAAEEAYAWIRMLFDLLFGRQLVEFNPERWPELHQGLLQVIEDGRRLRRQQRQ